MSITEKLTTIAENEEKVYKAGEKAENDRFWDAFQDKGNRTDYRFAFFFWSHEEINPKYKIELLSSDKSAGSMFGGCRNLKRIDKEKFDLSKGFYSPTSSSSTTDCFYQYCNVLEVAPDIGLQPGYLRGTFSDCHALHTIEILRITEETLIPSSPTIFRSCFALVNITIEGVIGNSGIDLHWSTKLSKESIESFINALSATKTGKSITFSKTARENAFTDEEWASLIATKPNWTISLS